MYLHDRLIQKSTYQLKSELVIELDNELESICTITKYDKEDN